jgi:hypothetical protein
MIVFQGATPIGSPIVGWIGSQFGPRWAVGIGSITALIVAAGAALWARRAWNVRLRYHVASRPYIEVVHVAPGLTSGRASGRGAARARTADRLGAQEAADTQSAA